MCHQIRILITNKLNRHYNYHFFYRHNNNKSSTVSDVMAMSESGGGWRGRAEKISLLKEQLRRARAAGAADGASVAPSEVSGMPSSVSAATEKQLARIGGIETNR
jgi:hypothetical protein